MNQKIKTNLVRISLERKRLGNFVVQVKMDFEDNQLPGMTVLDGIGIKHDDNYEDSNQENMLTTHGYG